MMKIAHGRQHWTQSHPVVVFAAESISDVARC